VSTLKVGDMHGACLVLPLLQVRDSDLGLHGSRLLAVAAAPANHSRSWAPARTLRPGAEILQADAYMYEMQEKEIPNYSEEPNKNQKESNKTKGTRRTRTLEEAHRSGVRP
jgi:hypothetical protein